MTKAVELAQVASTGVSEAFKNRLINGGMTVSQRGTSFTNVGSGSPPTYTLDRWVGFRGGYDANLDISQQTGFGPFQNCLRMQRTSGTSSTQGMQLNQVIETNNCFDMAGQNATISVTMRAGANYSGGAVTIGVQTSTTANDTSVNISAGAFTAGGFNAGPVITTTGTTYTATGTIPSNAKTVAIQIFWTPTGTAGAQDYIEVTGCQLEVGSSASSFEYLNFQNILAQCQRYYEKSYSIGMTVGTDTPVGLFQGVNTSDGNQVTGFRFIVPKRAAPTMTVWSKSGTVASVSNTSYVNGANTGTWAASDINEFGFRVVVGSGGLGSNNSWNYHYRAEIEL